MDRLWAPWREKYVTHDIKNAKGCIFCNISKEKKDVQNFIIARTTYSYAVLNIYPYNNGHLLVLPHRHVDDLKKLKREERDDLMDLLGICQDLLTDVMEPAGFNVGMNVGRVAGAGFPKHLHLHLVPRWKGDANFMTVTSDTRVMSQSLKDLHKRLTDAYKKRH